MMDSKCSKPCSFELKYDHVLMFDNPAVLTPLLTTWNLKSRCRKVYNDDVAAAVSDRLVEFLKTGLGPYVFDVVAAPRKDPKAPLLIGFQVNPARESVYVMKGPELGTEAADVFSSFWGSRAELRKYADGIHATVTWREGHVLLSMVDFLLKKAGCRVPDDGRGWHQVRHQLDAVLCGRTDSSLGRQAMLKGARQENGHADAPAGKRRRESETETPQLPRPFPPPEWSPRRVMDVFDSLAASLRRLSKRLPLDITGVTCVSPASYGAEVFPALPVVGMESLGDFLPSYTPLIEGLITLEISGKWPAEVATLRRAKLLFMHRVKALLLRESGRRLRSCRLDRHGRLLVFQGGHVFRLTLVVLKEISLLQEAVDSLGQRRKIDSPEARQLECTFVHLPAHCARVRNLCAKFPGLADTMRLFQRWLATQGLSEVLERQATEILCAAVFLHPEVMGARSPCTAPLAGFLRVLHLLAFFPWKSQPLLVDLDDGFQDVQLRSSARTGFSRTARSFLPALVLATPTDVQGRRWTSRGPSPAQLHALSARSEAALLLLLWQLRQPARHVAADAWPQAFRSRLMQQMSADVVLHLRPELLPRLFEGLDAEAWWRGLDQAERESVASTRGDAFAWTAPVAAERKKVRSREDERQRPWPPVSFDPGSTFVQQLRSNKELSALAEFFYDPHGGRAVMVKWRQAALRHLKSKTEKSRASCDDASEDEDEDEEEKEDEEEEEEGEEEEEEGEEEEGEEEEEEEEGEDAADELEEEEDGPAQKRPRLADAKAPPAVATVKSLLAHRVLQRKRSTKAASRHLAPSNEEQLVQTMVELGGGLVKVVDVVRLP